MVGQIPDHCFRLHLIVDFCRRHKLVSMFRGSSARENTPECGVNGLMPLWTQRRLFRVFGSRLSFLPFTKLFSIRKRVLNFEI